MNEVKGHGLTPEERELVCSVRKTMTWSIWKSLRENRYSDGTPFEAMKELFDNTSDDPNNIEAVARRKAIAECMAVILYQRIKNKKEIL